MSKDQEMSTRRQLLTMLKTGGPLTVGEMAKRLGITEMAVRRHLNTLERDGLAEARISRQAMGRPTHLYSLTALADDLFPKNYHHLALDLLGALEVEEGVTRVDRLFERRKENMIDKYGGRMAGKKLPEKVQELADIQNANGYMVELRQDEEGRFVLNEFNCPINQVASRYEQACRCELELFRRLLDADVERAECLMKGGMKCSYVIGPKPAELDEDQQAN